MDVQKYAKFIQSFLQCTSFILLLSYDSINDAVGTSRYTASIPLYRIRNNNLGMTRIFYSFSSGKCSAVVTKGVGLYLELKDERTRIFCTEHFFVC
jgi:hypothetical protein